MSKKKEKVSLQIIADRLGISKYAVSLALNNKPGVSEELRKKVIQTAHDMNYQGVRRISAKKNKNILVLIPEYIRNDTSFYNKIYWSIENEIKSLEYNAILASVSSKMEEELMLPSIYFEMGYSGIIIVGVFSNSYVIKLRGTGLPLVSVDQSYDSIQVDSVVSANEEGAYQVVKHLIDNGHTDIGFIGPVSRASSIYERWCGYYKAMTLSNLPLNENHCIMTPLPLDMYIHEQEEMGKLLKSMDTFPTAWFCAGDMIAINFINLLIGQNIKVPDEISVVGFDDIEASKIIAPKLTTYNVRRDLMGKTAVELLVYKIDHPGDIRKISLYGNLIIRDSVKTLN